MIALGFAAALLLTALMVAAIWAFTGADSYDENRRNEDGGEETLIIQ